MNGENYIRIAYALRYEVGAKAHFYQQRHMGMPKVMDADSIKPGCICSTLHIASYKALGKGKYSVIV